MPLKVCLYSKLFVIAALVLALDQSTKLLVESWYFKGNILPLEVASFLDIVFVVNKGISFGVFNEISYAQQLFSALNLIICAIIWFFISKEPIFFRKLLLTTVIAGAIGNIVDRIRIGGVIDFLDFHYQSWHYPAFNIADSAIVIGLVLYVFLPQQEVMNQSRNAQAQNNASS